MKSLLLVAVNYTYRAPSVWEWAVPSALEVQCGIFLVLSFFWLEISDSLMQRRLRKEQKWNCK